MNSNFWGLLACYFSIINKSDWTSSAESIFIYTVSGCNTLVSIIYLISFILRLRKIKCRRAQKYEIKTKANVVYYKPAIKENVSSALSSSKMVDNSILTRHRYKSKLYSREENKYDNSNKVYKRDEFQRVNFTYQDKQTYSTNKSQSKIYKRDNSEI